MTVPKMPNDIQEFITKVCKATGLYKEVLFAWMVAEDVKHLSGLKDNFNPLNIRYTYPDGNPALSSLPQFKEAAGIQGNLVVAYPDLDAGVRATIAVINLSYYIPVLKTVNKSPLLQAEAIQQSLWDAGHYHDNPNVPNDGSIVDLLESWKFIDIPKKVVEEKSLSQVESVLTAAQDVTESLGKLWNLSEDENQKNWLHFQAQMLRFWLVDHSYAAWNDNKTKVIHGTYSV